MSDKYRRRFTGFIAFVLMVLLLAGCDKPLQKAKYKAIKTVVGLAGADLSPNPALLASFDPERDEKAKEELGYTIGTQAYLYGVAGLRLENFRYGMSRLFKLAGTINPDRVSDVGEDGMTYNEYAYLKKLPNANMRFGASPNHDTLYGGIFFKLDKEPLVITVPEIKDRYSNLQITNAFFSNDGYINAKGTCSPCLYLLAGPDWKGSVPDAMTVVRTNTNEGYLAIRILIDGPEEYARVNEIQSRFDARPLANYLNPENKISLEPFLEPDDSGDLSVYRRIVEIALRNPTLKEMDNAAWSSFQYIGMFPDRPFDPEQIDPAIKRGMKRAIDTVHDIVAWKVKSRGYKSKTNWRVDLLGGDYGQNYLRRTESVVQGLFLHDPKEALYFLSYHDEKGELLTGENKYRLHFNADQLPPVHEFWSITLYDKSYNIVENPIQRFAIGDRTKGLHYNEDGSLTIYLQSDKADAGASNWLPTPAGDNFRLTFRMYKPKDVMFDPKTLEHYLPPIT
ncbi:DUF1214 domain-containing protein [bacterium]|nr:DUF1214 domain-containing protein [bacterium]